MDARSRGHLATGNEAPDPMTPRPFRVRAVRRETHDTATLELTPSAGGPLAFEAGQFTMLYVYGVGEVPISISGAPQRPEVLVHTVRAVGSVTKALLALRPGDTVGVRGPYGAPWQTEAGGDRDLLLVAGGIGLAPLRPVLYHATAHRARYRKVILLYGARTPEDLLYAEELHAWRAAFDLEVGVTVDRADRSWRGHVGVVTTLLQQASFDPDGSLALVCGPEAMMRFAALALLKRGVAGERIQLSLERNMKCGVGWCGHCQLGSLLLCRDGPVVAYPRAEPLLAIREV